MNAFSNTNCLKDESKKGFDPSYGYTLPQLKEVGFPKESEGSAEAWQEWYEGALTTQPLPEIKDTGKTRKQWRVFDLVYQSTDSAEIGGWLLLPESGVIERGFVVGHGYGGRVRPNFDLPLTNSALLFFCARGISRSPHGTISPEPRWHVLHDIQDRERYVLRGCVEDLWLGVSSLLRLFPQVAGRIGYLGTSFGGGIGAMALAWEKRVQRAYFCLPSFGNQPLRMQLKTLGSARSVQGFEKTNPGMASYTLAWYDAAIAARRIEIPVLCALAKNDPVVAPPSQFSIYNALPHNSKELFVLEAGHMDYDKRAPEQLQLCHQIAQFFKNL